MRTIEQEGGAVAGVADGEAFARLFRGHAASVAVVTTATPSGPVGFTATSVVSVSAEPPVLAFSLNRTSSSWSAVRAGSRVLVHFLAPEHESIATVFSRRDLDRFAEVDWRWDEHGLPRLDAVSTTAHARLVRGVEAGSSELFLGEVFAIDALEGRSPLVYCNRAYRRV